MAQHGHRAPGLPVLGSPGGQKALEPLVDPEGDEVLDKVWPHQKHKESKARDYHRERERKVMASELQKARKKPSLQAQNRSYPKRIASRNLLANRWAV